ncbi:DUF4783 domain-containing protein [Saccharicrinis sp. FJH2]|uniref:DUF4783 domain-containing protein n=1 Tax=unclassified Saccharicrinis TaxID=2646859 RepID=UPI0035D4369E
MKQILIILTLVLSATLLKAQTVDNLTSAIKMGSAGQLSQLFNSSVEIVINDDDKMYTKPQAQMVMSEFFKKNPPVDFNIAYDSTREDARYLIGNLTTKNNKTYRITFLLRGKGSTTLIHQIRIK